MGNVWQLFYDWPPSFFRNAVLSVVVIAAIVTARWFVIRTIRQRSWSPHQGPLRLTVQSRWLALGIGALGLAGIWATEIRTLAFSLVAIAAAIVLATKEIIMCLSGALVRASGQSFAIGDRIEVDGVRGDVVDHQVLTTTILEIGVGDRPTGRTVVIPNSTFLTAKVFNETLSDEYVLHQVAVPVARSDDLQSIHDRLMAIALEVCGPFQAPAKSSLDAISKRHGLRMIGADPDIAIHLDDEKSATLLLHVSVPARSRGKIEQDILARLLSISPADSRPVEVPR